MNLTNEEVHLVWIALGDMLGAPGLEPTKKQWRAAQDLFRTLTAAQNDGDNRVWFVRVHDMWSFGGGTSSREFARKFPTAIARSVADSHRLDGYTDVEMVEAPGAADWTTAALPPRWRFMEAEHASREVIEQTTKIEAEIDARPIGRGTP